MVAFVALPFHIGQVRVFGANGKDKIENGKPFVRRPLCSTTEEISKLSVEIQPSDHWKSGMDSVHVSIKQMIGNLWRGYFVEVFGLVTWY